MTKWGEFVSKPLKRHLLLHHLPPTEGNDCKDVKALNRSEVDCLLLASTMYKTGIVLLKLDYPTFCCFKVNVFLPIRKHKKQITRILLSNERWK